MLKMQNDGPQDQGLTWAFLVSSSSDFDVNCPILRAGQWRRETDI